MILKNGKTFFPNKEYTLNIDLIAYSIHLLQCGVFGMKSNFEFKGIPKGDILATIDD